MAIQFGKPATKRVGTLRTPFAKPVVKESLSTDTEVGIPTAKHKGGRPKSANPKVVLNIRVDADVLAKWKATGKGWQSRINDLLRSSL